jgi:hypothetical protein
MGTMFRSVVSFWLQDTLSQHHSGAKPDSEHVKAIAVDLATNIIKAKQKKLGMLRTRKKREAANRDKKVAGPVAGQVAEQVAGPVAGPLQAKPVPLQAKPVPHVAGPVAGPVAGQVAEQVAGPVAGPLAAEPVLQLAVAHWDFEKRFATMMYDGTTIASTDIYPLDPLKAGASKVGATFNIDNTSILAKVSLVWWDVVKKQSSSSSAPRVFRTFDAKKEKKKKNNKTKKAHAQFSGIGQVRARWAGRCQTGRARSAD